MTRFTQRTKANPWGDWMGVLHGDEIEYVFGHPLNSSGSHTVAEQGLSRKVMGYFSRFARTGYDFLLWLVSFYLFTLSYSSPLPCSFSGSLSPAPVATYHHCKHHHRLLHFPMCLMYMRLCVRFLRTCSNPIKCCTVKLIQSHLCSWL